MIKEYIYNQTKDGDIRIKQWKTFKHRINPGIHVYSWTITLRIITFSPWSNLDFNQANYSDR